MIAALAVIACLFGVTSGICQPTMARTETFLSGKFYKEDCFTRPTKNIYICDNNTREYAILIRFYLGQHNFSCLNVGYISSRFVFVARMYNYFWFISCRLGTLARLPNANLAF